MASKKKQQIVCVLKASCIGIVTAVTVSGVGYLWLGAMGFFK